MTKRKPKNHFIRLGPQPDNSGLWSIGIWVDGSFLYEVINTTEADARETARFGGSLGLGLAMAASGKKLKDLPVIEMEVYSRP